MCFAIYSSTRILISFFMGRVSDSKPSVIVSRGIILVMIDSGLTPCDSIQLMGPLSQLLSQIQREGKETDSFNHLKLFE